MSHTIERIMVTFLDIIYSSNKEWSETEIRQQLADKGYCVSQPQLNRDLNRYHHHFGVERLDLDNSYHAKPVYRRKKTRFSESRMNAGELQFLTVLLTINEQLGKHLPPEAEHYLADRVELLNTQRSILQRNVPHDPLFAFEQNIQLLAKYAANDHIDQAVIAALRYALTKQQDIILHSSEYVTSEHDTFSPVKVYEHCGELFVSGMSSLEGGTNRNYSVSKLLSVQSVAVETLQSETRISASGR
jgi:hypothetical protein